MEQKKLTVQEAGRRGFRGLVAKVGEDKIQGEMKRRAAASGKKQLLEKGPEYYQELQRKSIEARRAKKRVKKLPTGKT